MRVGSIYRKYFRNNLFIKIILLFSVITIVTIIAFSYLMFRSMSATVINRELDNQKKAMESINNNITSKHDSVNAMIEGLYRDSSLSAGMTYFLTHSYPEYVQHNLEMYDPNTSRVGSEVLQYFKNKLEDDTDISNLILYSADQQSLYAYNHNKLLKFYNTDSVHTYIPDAMALEGGSITLPNGWIRKVIQQWDTHLYSVRMQINDRQSYTNIGQLVVYYNSDSIWKALADDKDELKGRILVLTNEGGVLFDSLGRMYGKVYPNMDKIDSFYESSELVQNTYVTKLTQSKGGVVVLGMISAEEMAQSYRGLRNTILTISAICIFVAIVIPSLFVIRFAKRTNEIIRFTHKVKKGDLSARIHNPKEDELGQISHSFNEMLDELNQYIDQVYKADIKQKESELTALQARINPHFLYNTLEVIRMRAISHGAQDVSEMIYSLSALFRSFVQQKTIYLLKDELEACRLYLELFRIRYKDKFSYVIECDSELGRKRFLRMSLQPIIENYIVHGLRSERTDNQITIKAMRFDKGIRVQIIDNGNGIAEDRLGTIKQMLSPDAPEGESFGLRSVNERIKLLYGSEYGIQIESNPGVGTSVNIWLPSIEDKESYDV
ncbi:two-component sensor histidine kinase [Paenibacillus baekrokdamisoli]|uniref:histidine kinase n=1 Tax=Paenibacillus baekrokdamisoli TaxID=1712516 RepID=A0A3G9J7Y3_9BACL|nr:histidine kinase [Paenibacillus baekrokdamisoli]MBB3071537.1 two-component system sensor histidine kinase YesM [Paenibacillus baekrokdamisoli]BBH21951.1 two-component sensor histidine kinase [Paenibacillus baekrokdamisoli]